MLALILLGDVLTQLPSPKADAKASAIATVRIERSTRVSAEDWPKNKTGQWREIKRHDSDGRDILLRLIEMP